MPSPHKTREIATQASGGTSGINAETLAGTKTLTTNDVVYHKLDPAGDRTVVLPTAANSFKGQTFVIFNNSDATGEVITVNQSSTDSSTTRATIGKGESVTVIRSSASAWTAMAEQKGNRARVIATDSASNAIDAESSGCIVVIDTSSNDVTCTLPTAEVGLNYTFIVTIGGNDLELVSPSATNFFIGGLVHLDANAGSSGDEVAPVVSDNNSNDFCTMLLAEAGTRVEVVCDGTNWHIGGYSLSNTIPSFTDATGL